MTVLILISIFSWHISSHHAEKKFLEASSIIVWCESYKLSFNDFNANNDSLDNMLNRLHNVSLERSKINAFTATGVSIEGALDSSNNEVSFLIYAFVQKNKSWINFNDTLLLNHEQLHFDISELVARKLRKVVSEEVVTQENMFRVFEDLDSMQQTLISQINIDYDTQTMHGASLEAQRDWQQKISNELMQLQQYKLDCIGNR